MTTAGFMLFNTPIGRCSIVFAGNTILGVQLPEASESATRARIAQRFPHAQEVLPPPAIQRTAEDIAAVLSGKPGDFSTLTLDMDKVPPFHRLVYEAARAIAPGTTISYGEIAQRLGAPRSARAVGQALKRNPFAIIVPCHRVLTANGKIGGFTADGGIETKRRLLAMEGVSASNASARDALDLLGGEFDFDPVTAVAHLRACDIQLARLIDAVGPFAMTLNKTSDLFAALAEAIVYQQLSGKAAATIFTRVCALFPRTRPTAATLSRITDEQLRSAGLSRSKILALRDLAQKVMDCTLPTLATIKGMHDDEIIERLIAVRGIGRWTAEMVLMFRLGRADVLPVDDYGIRKGFAVAFRTRELPTRLAVEKRGLRWKPFRTVASWYLWRAVELGSKYNIDAKNPAV